MGRHKNQLHSFGLALRDAGIEKFSLVTVSGILPAVCQIVSREKGQRDLRPVQIVFLVARNATNDPNRTIT